MYSRFSIGVVLGVGKFSFSNMLSSLCHVETDPEGSALSELEVISTLVAIFKSQTISSEIFGAVGDAIFTGLRTTFKTLAILFPFLGVLAGADATFDRFCTFDCSCIFEHSCTFVSIPIMGVSATMFVLVSSNLCSKIPE
jgi:hypothetical protein